MRENGTYITFKDSVLRKRSDNGGSFSYRNIRFWPKLYDERKGNNYDVQTPIYVLVLEIR